MWGILITSKLDNEPECYGWGNELLITFWIYSNYRDSSCLFEKNSQEVLIKECDVESVF